MNTVEAKEVILGCPDLDSDLIASRLGDLIAEAEAVCQADLEGWYDWAVFDSEPVPLSVRRLMIAKARELGYRAFYGPERPQNSEVEYFRKDYDRQLDMIRSGKSSLPVDAIRGTGEVGFY